MAFLFKSTNSGRGKLGTNQRSERWSLGYYWVSMGILCSILLSVWLGWKYGKFWQESQAEFTPQSWQADRTVNISLVTRAVETGAVCLDGSPPAYFLDKGFGDGANNWIVFLEGGGWCTTFSQCLERAFTDLGSSRRMPSRVRLGGILNRSPVANPEFYNWNRVLVKYCDGGSFNGDVSDPVEVEVKDVVTKIFFRGQRIWKAVMEELMQQKGMENARKALLTGCSAGGLATILHCDQFRELMPKDTYVKCSSDAGFFIDIPDISGMQTIEALYRKVVQMQNMAGNLPKSCTSEREPTKCIFPEYFLTGIQTPLFMLNPAYDTWQFSNILVPRSADPEGIWDSCSTFLSSCSETQLSAAGGFRESLLQRLQPLLDDAKHGAFINSCFLHCQSQDATWHGSKSPKVDKKSIAQVVGDWYFNRNLTKVIDCPFPCNPTCGRFT